MNTLQIDNKLKQFDWINNHYCGIYSVDKLPKSLRKKPCSFVINTDPSYLPGQHWVVVYFPKNGLTEYFDSFGLKPYIPEIKSFISLNGKNFIYNKKQIQYEKSSSCGRFCIMYIAYKSKNYSLFYFINLFSINLQFNESLLKKLYYNFFK